MPSWLQNIQLKDTNTDSGGAETAAIAALLVLT